MNLLLDLGNSRLKWMFSEKQGQTLEYSDITAETLCYLWRDLQPRKIGISCVGQATLLNLIKVVAHELWRDIPIHFAISEFAAFGVINSYVEPEKLGIDRWLALIAARQKTDSSLCVVDCGTAITVDVLNEKGEHQGGLICAGLTLMKNALASNTADLPFANSTQKLGLATETESAIYNGAVFSACGLIEKVMQQQPENTKLFLTGGDSEIIASQLNCVFTIEQNLVLNGLNLFLNSK